MASATYPPAGKKIVNAVMLTLTGLCAFAVVAVLIFILGYLVVNGARSLNWSFFTKLPVPVGEEGGGMANAIVGSGKLLMIAATLGVPLGLLGGVFLLRLDRPLHHRSAQRRTLDRHGHLRLHAGRAADAPLLDARRRHRTGHHDDPHRPALHRRVPSRRAPRAA
jgi:hypothetical protein